MICVAQNDLPQTQCECLPLIFHGLSREPSFFKQTAEGINVNHFMQHLEIDKAIEKSSILWSIRHMIICVFSTESNFICP